MKIAPVKKQHYINNKDFTELLIAYHNGPETKQGIRAHNKIGKVFLLLADKIANGGSWRGYSPDIKEEMINDAVYTMIKNLNKYDHEKFDNPFSYFTSVTINIYRQSINKMKLNMDRNVRFDFLSANGLEYLIVDDSFGGKINHSQVTKH
jgi:hypothetical protein